ncbi:MAG TPA: FHA domain-containing protein [Tepidisphaeraceae bacterium]|jgi:predicted component of type VI protein secretion system|nr:FHA domain-containing protein [Tepidisphaeraceae bacterium]
MAILIIEQNGKRRAGALVGRVLIGRWPDNSIVIDDKAVSRIHAWVGVQDGRFYIADAGSRTGTMVNGALLQERHILSDRDEIQIGPATLRYRSDNVVPADAGDIDLSPRTPAELSGKHGVFMDCVCGAPLWLPSNFAGVGQCRYCGNTVTQGVAPAAIAPQPQAEMQSDHAEEAAGGDMIPELSHAAAQGALAEPNVAMPKHEAPSNNRPAPPAHRHVMPPAPVARPRSMDLGPAIPSVNKSRSAPAFASAMSPVSAPAALAPLSPSISRSGRGNSALQDQVCGICHAPITVFDEVSACPSCGLGFHADCWKENHGCSAYGCSQVGAVQESR